MRVKNTARMMMKEFCISLALMVLLVVKERVTVGKVVHCCTTVKGEKRSQAGINRIMSDTSLGVNMVRSTRDKGIGPRRIPLNIDHCQRGKRQVSHCKNNNLNAHNNKLNVHCPNKEITVTGHLLSLRATPDSCAIM